MLKGKINKLILKGLFLTAISLFTLHIISAQTQTTAYKLAEYESPQGGGCDEYFRMVEFVGKINQEQSRGVVVIYSGNNSERFGNLLAYAFWAKRYLTDRMGVPPE